MSLLTSTRITAQRVVGVLQRAQASTSTSASGSTPRRRRSQPSESENVDLVAPPDPDSNIRPVIYASTPKRRRSGNSPYSTTEFPSSNTGDKLEELEMEWRMRRERVDLMNHRFWSTTNQNFNAQLAHRLSLLPPSSDPPTPTQLQAREDCLSQFYADWQIHNRPTQAKWVKEWWREIWSGLKLQTRIYWLRGFSRS